MGKPSAPDAPDPQETSAAQTGTSVATALANTMLGNVNQIGADGSTLNYDQTGTYSFTDPYTGMTYDIPTFTATTSLSDAAQGIYDTNQITQQNLASLGADQSAFLQDYMSQPFSYGVGEHEAWAGGLYDSINGDNLAQQQSQLETRLANQGVVPGSAAYDAAMKNLYSGQQTSRDQFMLDSYNTGMNTALTNRTQPLNEIIGLMSGTQVATPTYSQNTPSQIATTDNAGLINNAYNQDMQAYQNQMSGYNGIMGGLFGLGKAAIMASDRRLKKDISLVRSGDLNVYEYRYIWEPDTAPLRRGYMAQEVLEKFPHAVRRFGEFFAVDYSKLEAV
ncbi:tail fiber domain-containing protein [Celeribacter naphthalenivorans]|uniref:tail fiber domain-containing protein n=1 Tax=Celeribacter naphthalenivorans TaxID=1614694 RepID=UPI001CFABCDA|nr:tail fiber domain-containing protein [Celeribacter naphthalenivorans]